MTKNGWTLHYSAISYLSTLLLRIETTAFLAAFKILPLLRAKQVKNPTNALAYSCNPPSLLELIQWSFFRRHRLIGLLKLPEKRVSQAWVSIFTLFSVYLICDAYRNDPSACAVCFAKYGRDCNRCLLEYENYSSLIGLQTSQRSIRSTVPMMLSLWLMHRTDGKYVWRSLEHSF